MQIRQSSLKAWASCPLKYKYTHIDKLPREQSASLTFGSVLHDVILYMEKHQNLEAAIERFKRYWVEPTLLDPRYKIDYFVRGTNWKKYMDEGQRILRDWWSIIQWESDVVLAREHEFDVPIGDGHTLHGTVDKLTIRHMPKINSDVVLISDYKSTRKQPTYDYLAEDLQFTAYAYASTQPEFWSTLPSGAEMFGRVKELPRHGEWVQLTGPKRMDAGERAPRHYKRLEYAVNEIARSIEAKIFPPTISGETCRYCEFRKLCGLPELDENGQEI